MYTRRFQTLITTGHFTLPVAIVLSIFCWISAVCFLDSPNGHWMERFAGFILYGFIGYLLIELNNVYAIIRMRASVQTAAFFLLVSACPSIQSLSTDFLAYILLLLALFFLFRSYQKTAASTDLYATFACLGLSSMILPSLCWLAPVFWIGAYGFQSLTFKSFLASLVGWLLPYWFLFGHAYFHEQMHLFYAPFQQMVHIWPIDFHFQPWEIATEAYLFILYLVSASHCLIARYEDKIRTRCYLHFLIFFTCCLFLYILIQPHLFLQLLPLQLIGISFLSGHLFALTNTRSSNLFFISTLLGLCLLFSFNVWTLS